MLAMPPAFTSFTVLSGTECVMLCRALHAQTCSSSSLLVRYVSICQVKYLSTSKLYNKLNLYLKMFFVCAHGCDNAIDTP